jgi:NAD(P)-dependent dehydrogenase (short-subunit alcohol dehydrogenase family)
LVTGGNSGIGLATARLFKAEGARVAIVGRDPATLEQARIALGDDTLALRSDVGRLSDIDAAMEAIGSHFGQLDIVVANAAIARPAPFHLTTEEQFDDITTIAFKGLFFTIQKALPLMSKGGAVTLTTSISNQVGAPNFGVYAACKAALRSLAQTLSLELIERGIRVNAVSPGPIDTPGFGRWEVPEEVVEAARQGFLARSPVKRFGDPDEVARAILFLVSSDASYVVGHELVVDGGVSLLL